MSSDFIKDIHDMHTKYGVREAVQGLNGEKLAKFLEFRFDFLQEEVDEGQLAITEKDADGVVDSLIDLIVVALGTLDALQVDAATAWNRVLVANLNKEVGIKASRPNPLGLPDLIKAPDWVAPTHEDNVGLIPKAF